MSFDVGPRANDGDLPIDLLLLAGRSGGHAMAKHEHLPVGGLCADLLSEQTLKSALSALQRGPIRFRRDHVIACEGDDADYVFLVVSGVLRSCKTFQDGSRSVVAFYLPGDLFGLGDEVWPLSIEAASNAVVMLLKRRSLAALAVHNTGLAGFLLMAVTSELGRAQEHAAIISMTAKEWLLTFLKDWLKQRGASGSVQLPMGYPDIADHLGMKIETLSRVITELEQSGALSRGRSRGTLNFLKPLIAS